jgi:hypothetical protein
VGAPCAARATSLSEELDKESVDPAFDVSSEDVVSLESVARETVPMAAAASRPLLPRGLATIKRLDTIATCYPVLILYTQRRGATSKRLAWNHSAENHVTYISHGIPALCLWIYGFVELPHLPFVELPHLPCGKYLHATPLCYNSPESFLQSRKSQVANRG